MNLIEPAAPVSSAAVGTAAGYHWGYFDVHANQCDDHSEDNAEDDAGAAAEAHAEAHAGAQWRLIHHRLLELASQQAELDYEQGQLLRAALQAGVHVELGYGSFVEYSERVMGHSPRQTGERLRVAEALEELPEMAKALRTGQLCWSVIRELSRVAVPETESEWLQEAAGKTARDVEKSVSGKQKGQRPADPVAPEVKTHRLSFEVSAEVLATFRDAVDKLRRDTGEKLSEEEALMMMARQALVGPGQEGRAGYQVAMTVCECCEQGYQEVRGELVPVGSEAVERALCDAQHIGLAAGTGADAHVGTGMETAPDGTHVGTSAPPPVAIPVRPPRATQAIPPAVGRQVRRRQHGRCAVPGCRCHLYIDLHHLRYQHDGKCGPDDIIGLCWAHHQRVHAGLLLIVGTPSTELRFYHADGSEYGRRVSADALAVRTQAFNALVGMGFRKQQVREALAQVCAGAGSRPSLDSVIRQALDTLTSTRTAPPVH